MFYLQNVMLMLYINHTDLLEVMFRLVGVPANLRVSLWRNLAAASANPMAYPPDAQSSQTGLPYRRIHLPDMLTYCRRSHAQRCLAKLIRLQTRRGEDMRQAFFDASVTKTKEDMKETIVRVCTQLQEIITIIDQLKAVPDLNVSPCLFLIMP